MPRINLDDDFFVDPRLQRLAIRYGCFSKAIGDMVRLYRLAQEYFVKDKLIPARLYEKEFSPDIAECDLVEKKGGGYYVRGANDRFNWLKMKKEAGKLGGERNISRAKRDETGRFTAKQNPSKTKHIQPSDSDSDSDSDSYSDSDLKNKYGATEKSVAAFIGLWMDYNKGLYNSDVPRTGKFIGTAKRIVKDLGFQKAADLAEAYFAMRDKWFVTKQHDIFTFEQNLNKIQTYLKTGKSITADDAKKIETAEYNARALKAVLSKGGENE